MPSSEAPNALDAPCAGAESELGSEGEREIGDDADISGITTNSSLSGQRLLINLQNLDSDWAQALNFYGEPASETPKLGPTIDASWRPPLMRQTTALSWRSSEPPEEVQRPTWKRGLSSLSSRSSKSTSSSTSRKRRRDTRMSSSPPPADGGRRICFDNEGSIVEPSILNTANNGYPNLTRTARFTVLTWLPKSLYWQFRRVANIYFLFISVLVCFPWSPKDWKSKVFPFVGVLLWTACKDFVEDIRRRKDDAIENSQIAIIYDRATGSFAKIPWSELKIGDLVVVVKDTGFPADMVLLSSGSGDTAFLSTVTLDGETNLKERSVPALTLTMMNPRRDKDVKADSSQKLGYSEQAGYSEQERQVLHVANVCHTAELSVSMAKPEANLHSVRGVLQEMNQAEVFPISEAHFLPRGCILRNTPWVIGVVTFCGADTKVRLNAGSSRRKLSSIQANLNFIVYSILCALAIIALYAGSQRFALVGRSDGFCCSPTSWLVSVFEYIIILYHVLPMSVYVCYEMLKLILVFFVNTDQQMVDAETGEATVARSSDLVEELGQVDIVFTDKTGTLTKNQMLFARCFTSGRDFGDFRNDDGGVAGSEGHMAVQATLRRRPDMQTFEEVRWFFTCLAVCHTVQVRRNANAKVWADAMKYSGASPDEVALVKGAHEVGISFDSRVRDNGCQKLIVTGPGQKVVNEFKLFHILEFSSHRRRMSVIVENKGDLWIITKGADSVMETLMNEPFSQARKEPLSSFSRQGLRTLVVGSAKLDRSRYSTWEARYKDAQAVLDDSRDLKVEEVEAEIEKDLDFVGITALEDRLQDGVPETIAVLRKAGMRIWVLTGDKVDTAVDIAYACALFDETTTLTYVTAATTVAEAEQLLIAARTQLEDVDASQAGLVLSGSVLQLCLDDKDCRRMIFELGLKCRTCVCCRLSPIQKRQLLDLVREESPTSITLAIGDGANDVPMIEGAHVGVGVRGREGAAAVQVCDVAISQFRFLAPLLLCHGRRAYARVAILLLFYLYKSVALAAADFIFMHQNGFMSAVAFPEYVSVNYNVLFVSWHVVLVLAFDEDVPDEVSLQKPELYAIGPNRAYFNAKVLICWFGLAVIHGTIAWLVPVKWFGGTAFQAQTPSDFWLASITAFCVLVITVDLKLLTQTSKPWKFALVASTLLSLVCLFGSLFVLSNTSIGQSLQPSIKELTVRIFRKPEALTCLLVLPFVSLVPDLLLWAAVRLFQFARADEEIQLPQVAAA